MFSRLWIRFSFAYQVSIQKRRMYSLFSLFGLDWIYFILFIFNWRIIALQCCVSFCCRATWTSCKYTYVPSLLNLPAPPAPSHPSRLSQGTGLGWTPCVMYQLATGCFTRGNAYVPMLLSIHPTLSFPWCVYKSILYVCVFLYSCPAKRFISTIF